MSTNKGNLITELLRILSGKFEKYEDSVGTVFLTAEGLIRVSYCYCWSSFGRDAVIVEWADNGIEADNGLFDDVGIYYNDMSELDIILRDLEFDKM